MNWFQIKAFVNKLKTNSMNKDTKTKVQILKDELEYWNEYEPVNGMGKFARKTRIDSLTNQIRVLEDEGPEYDSAGFTEEDRVVNGEYKTNDNLKK